MSVPVFYEVGGCVRDSLLGKVSKDIDYSVEVESFSSMEQFLTSIGFEVFVSNEEFLTLRARFPRTITTEVAALFPPNELLGQVTADFVMCRKDGTYTDGRRPDEVFAGSIADDLARRDFTVNAIARRCDGSLVDLFDGVADLEAGVLRAVGDPFARLAEDALRALRAVRFAITKGFVLDADLRSAVVAPGVLAGLAATATERRREELVKAMSFDTPATLALLSSLGPEFVEAVFAGDLWLKATMEKA